MSASLYAAALDSARWNSMNPERFADGCINEYQAHMDAVRAEFERVAADPERAAAEFAAYSEGYERRYRAWLSARGRTASAMVTGPAKFPTRRNGKALDTERRRSQELTEWSDRARKAAVKRLKPPRDEAADLARMERTLELMKAANKVVRRKIPDDEKLTALVGVGLSEPVARKVLEPDFCGRVGFPAYELSSLRGKIKRLRGAS